jgi:RNA ligase
MTQPQPHPARRYAFRELVAGLEHARSIGAVSAKRPVSAKHLGDLSLWVYTQSCVYGNLWDAFSLMARGLILDHGAETVVATPFPKFFNLGEHGLGIPDQPFEVAEKLDGSLIVIWHHRGGWHCSTKGAFDSDQAKWAQNVIDGMGAEQLAALQPGTTYLAECIGPQNPIVVRYDAPAMVLLAAYAADGMELSRGDLETLSRPLGWRLAGRQECSDVAELVGYARHLPSTQEGFVLRFADGTRLKIKGAEYSRIHALISRCTPLGVWDAMFAKDDLDRIRHDLPEEFLADFDAIRGLLERQLDGLIDRLSAAGARVAALTDKELGLTLQEQPADIRPFLFAWRKSGGRVEGKLRDSLLRAVRPTANVLESYVPSYAMGRVLSEAG